jgi:hypothetical protein
MIVVAKLTARELEELAEGRTRVLLGELPRSAYRMVKAEWSKDFGLELTLEPVEAEEEPAL